MSPRQGNCCQAGSTRWRHHLLHRDHSASTWQRCWAATSLCTFRKQIHSNKGHPTAPKFYKNKQTAPFGQSGCPSCCEARPTSKGSCSCNGVAADFPRFNLNRSSGSFAFTWSRRWRQKERLSCNASKTLYNRIGRPSCKGNDFTQHTEAVSGLGILLRRPLNHTHAPWCCTRSGRHQRLDRCRLHISLCSLTSLCLLCCRSLSLSLTCRSFLFWRHGHASQTQLNQQVATSRRLWESQNLWKVKLSSIEVPVRRKRQPLKLVCKQSGGKHYHFQVGGTNLHHDTWRSNRPAFCFCCTTLAASLSWDKVSKLDALPLSEHTPESASQTEKCLSLVSKQAVADPLRSSTSS